MTVLGWLAIVGGLVRIFFPSRLAAIAGRVAHSTALIIGMAIVLLLISAFLSFKAYSRD